MILYNLGGFRVARIFPRPLALEQTLRADKLLAGE
jgi:hypothetical protein